MTHTYRVIIWGAGFMYYAAVNTILSIEEKGQIEVLGIMADSLPKSGMLDGFPILPKEMLRDLDFDYLLLCLKSERTDAIQSIVMTYGIPREKIIRSSVLLQPRFDFERYIRLRESNITIVSDLCWGGFIYKRLDLRCASPFRNLYIDRDDYLRLLGDLRGYCDMELVHAGFEVDPDGITRPVMELGDVRLHFNHVETPEGAASEWCRRIDRMNWENLFIMMWTDNRAYEHAFNELEGYQKRICFVPYESSEPYSFHLIPQPSDTFFHETVNKSAAIDVGAYPFDLVKLLLGESDYARYTAEGGRHA